MKDKEVQKIVRLLLEDSSFRKSFSQNPKEALKKRSINITKEQLNAILSLKDAEVENLRNTVTTMKNDPHSNDTCTELVVICVCGVDYFVR